MGLAHQNGSCGAQGCNGNTIVGDTQVSINAHFDIFRWTYYGDNTSALEDRNNIDENADGDKSVLFAGGSARPWQ